MPTWLRKGFRQRNSTGIEHLANEPGTHVHTHRGLAGKTKLISSSDHGQSIKNMVASQSRTSGAEP